MSEPNQPRPAGSGTEADASPPADVGEVPQPTQPVAGVGAPEAAAAQPVRPPVPGARAAALRRRPGQLTIMGPWAPVAGGLLGLVVGVVALLLLRGAADEYSQRLSLVLLVVGLT